MELFTFESKDEAIVAAKMLVKFSVNKLFIHEDKNLWKIERYTDKDWNRLRLYERLYLIDKSGKVTIDGKFI